MSSAAARANASSPHGYQSTGLSACWRRYGLVSDPSRFMRALGLPGEQLTRAAEHHRSGHHAEPPGVELQDGERVGGRTATPRRDDRGVVAHWLRAVLEPFPDCDAGLVVEGPLRPALGHAGVVVRRPVAARDEGAALDVASLIAVGPVAIQPCSAVPSHSQIGCKIRERGPVVVVDRGHRGPHDLVRHLDERRGDGREVGHGALSSAGASVRRLIAVALPQR